MTNLQKWFLIGTALIVAIFVRYRFLRVNYSVIYYFLEVFFMMIAGFVSLFSISYIGCYFRYPKYKEGKRSWIPSEMAFKKARGTGLWGVVLYLVCELILRPIAGLLQVVLSDLFRG